MNTVTSFTGYWRATVFVEAFQIRHANRKRSSSYFLFWCRSPQGILKPFKVVHSLREADLTARDYLADGSRVLWKDDQVEWSKRPTPPWFKRRSARIRKRRRLRLVWSSPNDGDHS